MTIEDPSEKGFLTDQDDIAEVTDEEDGLTPDGLPPEPHSAVVMEPELVAGSDLSILDARPTPGTPREYLFPSFERGRLGNGLSVVYAHVPGRPLLGAQLIMPGGGWTEPADQAGITVLTARAMPEGTKRLDANEFIEASERLGAEIHADASWEALTATMEVPRSRFGAALALMAEMAFEPAFPGDEVERLRDERLNDLLQAWSDPRRRSERVFPETVYAPGSPTSRPLWQSSVHGPPPGSRCRGRASSSAPRSRSGDLVVAGDLTGVPLMELAEEHLGRISALPTALAADSESGVAPHSAGARIVLVDRPSAPQSELRIGHVGVPRKTPDFHAISVLNAILGGTFNSRLNRVIREELGYTYGIHSSFDMRRRAGPFVVRTAVETAVTVPALVETLRIVREFGQTEVEPEELKIARDYLVGVFPLRFESAGPGRSRAFGASDLRAAGR